MAPEHRPRGRASPGLGQGRLIRTGIERALRHVRHDPLQIPALIWKNLCYPFTAEATELRYDRAMGIDTAGVIEADQLGHGAGAKCYHATPPGIAEFMIAQVAPRARDFTFVDVGSGKGRVLLLAARHPFRKVIGVELSEQLCRIARQNIRSAAHRLNCIAPIEIVHLDARNFVLPTGNCVLFLYSPFLNEVADPVINNVVQSFEAEPREIAVLYYSDVFPARLSLPPFVTRELPAQPRDRRYRYRRFDLRAVMFLLAPERGHALAGSA